MPPRVLYRGGILASSNKGASQTASQSIQPFVPRSCPRVLITRATLHYAYIIIIIIIMNEWVAQ